MLTNYNPVETATITTIKAHTVTIVDDVIEATLPYSHTLIKMFLVDMDDVDYKLYKLIINGCTVNFSGLLFDMPATVKRNEDPDSQFIDVSFKIKKGSSYNVNPILNAKIGV